MISCDEKYRMQQFDRDIQSSSVKRKSKEMYAWVIF